ncbi:hypothetical protein [Streptomyces sp. NPDC057702]|uniref:hypothetical protein n=1 Tax=Streptomyces sp. NPDC057702 TaxID=3346221 RepID=UPI0036A355C8
MPAKPREPWRVILTQRGVQLAEVAHPSETKAFAHVRAALKTGADTAKVMHWEDGQWRHRETLHARDVQP